MSLKELLYITYCEESFTFSDSNSKLVNGTQIEVVQNKSQILLEDAKIIEGDNLILQCKGNLLGKIEKLHWSLEHNGSNIFIDQCFNLSQSICYKGNYLNNSFDFF